MMSPVELKALFLKHAVANTSDATARALILAKEQAALGIPFPLIPLSELAADPLTLSLVLNHLGYSTYHTDTHLVFNLTNE